MGLEMGCSFSLGEALVDEVRKLDGGKAAMARSEIWPVSGLDVLA